MKRWLQYSKLGCDTACICFITFVLNFILFHLVSVYNEQSRGSTSSVKSIAK
jgi:hypothetical protein